MEAFGAVNASCDIVDVAFTAAGDTTFAFSGACFEDESVVAGRAGFVVAALFAVSWAFLALGAIYEVSWAAFGAVGC